MIKIGVKRIDYAKSYKEVFSAEIIYTEIYEGTESNHHYKVNHNGEIKKIEGHKFDHDQVKSDSVVADHVGPIMRFFKTLPIVETLTVEEVKDHGHNKKS